jgi:hypothetical protein
MLNIDDATLLVALKDWSNAVGTYWSFYNALGLGAVGFAINLGKEGASPRARWLLIAAFLACAGGNHFALIRSHTIMLEVSKALRARAVQADSIDVRAKSVVSAQLRDSGTVANYPAKEYREVMKAAPPVSVLRVRLFHVGISLMIAGVIWLASEPRKRAELAAA